MSWFSSPVYSRYWQHYQQAMAWHQRHKRAYQKALEAAYGPIYHRQRERYADWRAWESDREERESSSDSEIECDVSNMEISEELRQYFAQTEKHREELSKWMCNLNNDSRICVYTVRWDLKLQISLVR